MVLSKLILIILMLLNGTHLFAEIYGNSTRYPTDSLLKGSKRISKTKVVDEPWDSILVRHNIIKTDLAILTYISRITKNRNFYLSYERIIRPKQSITISSRYSEVEMSNNWYGYLDNELVNYGYNLSQNQTYLLGEYRFYLSKLKDKFPQAFYAGFAFSTGYSESTYDYFDIGTEPGAHYEYTYTSVGVGFCFGYHFLIWNRLSIDLDCVFQRGFYLSKQGKPTMDRFGFITGGGIGYAF